MLLRLLHRVNKSCRIFSVLTLTDLLAIAEVMFTIEGIQNKMFVCLPLSRYLNLIFRSPDRILSCDSNLIVLSACLFFFVVVSSISSFVLCFIVFRNIPHVFVHVNAELVCQPTESRTPVNGLFKCAIVGSERVIFATETELDIY